ncbi:MAG: AgmX/PglI C-terminal domain-containing protein [Bacteriovoracaceae bacterium]|jgi:pSer/pThr/pTyr-binding forkhead associated (FHA) protein/outer membrane biosynthesis protein TonB|nr:AgmX/PglI C-terminal domain-containing protein [Bacteriovoracaceae bacterium]
MSNLDSNLERIILKLTPKSNVGVKGNILSNGRVLVGRAQSCELYIDDSNVSSVHAVVEVQNGRAKVFDMNSKNGTFINGKKVVVAELSVGDEIRFANVDFILEKYTTQSNDIPLEVLNPVNGQAAPINDISLPKEVPSTKEKNIPVEALRDSKKDDNEDIPYIAFPLSEDKNADVSEYIFEDANEIYPIFKYEHSKQAVEVIILFNDKVFSVDYIPEKNGVYKIVGANPTKDQIEFAYLGKTEQVDFVEINNGNYIVYNLHNYEASIVGDNGLEVSSQDRFNLKNDDILRLENGALEIYVRRAPSPPKVTPPPFFKRDKVLWKYISSVLGILILLFALILLWPTPEKEKEKDPERIARILYKQVLKVSKNKTVEKTKKAPPKKQKTKNKVTKKKTKPKASKPKTTEVKKNNTKKSGTKKAKTVQKVKRVKNPAKKSPNKNKLKTASAAKKSTKTASTRKATRPSKNKGTIDVYKSFDFKSTVSAIQAKGGSLKGATANTSSNTSLTGASIGGGVATNVKKANVGTEVGSLTGSASGKLAESKGTEGLSTNKGTYVAGIPSETVVLGSMDPDVIRRILREHLPQFRYCYQKELDKSVGSNISGTVGLQFTIGASGHVSKAGVKSSTLPSNVRGCVVRVLKGIKFPRPMGGGTVDVNQPFNFYPKRL